MIFPRFFYKYWQQNSNLTFSKKKANFLDDQLYYGLGYSSNSHFSTKLFSGAIYNSNQVDIYVQVYDYDGAFVIYKIKQSITVWPDLANLETIIDKLTLADLNYDSNVILLNYVI